MLFKMQSVYLLEFEYSKVYVKIQIFFDIRKRKKTTTSNFHQAKNCEISESRI